MTPCECKKCGNKWQSKVEVPGICPKCKNPDWDTPSQRRKSYIAKEFIFEEAVDRARSMFLGGRK